MIITQTPLRISFLGGSTDFPEYYLKYGGFVLTTTIDKYIYCIVKERKFDDEIRVNYSIKEIVTDVNKLKHELVRESLKLLGITKGIELSFLSDIPTEGTGLGSSSAVTVGVLNALHNYLGDGVSARQLAEEAVKIELDILKKPMGVHDQYIAALGGLRWINFKESGEILSERIDLPDEEYFNNSLMLFYTGIMRKTKDILSSVDIRTSKSFLDKFQELAVDGLYALANGNLPEFAELLDDYWYEKKEFNRKVSNNEIDLMYKKALDVGAIGGKIIGAGGGGFMLLMVPENRREAVREKLKGYKELPFRLEKDGSKVIFNK